MNESRYIGWCKAMQGTVNECADFELNSLRDGKSTKTITDDAKLPTLGGGS